MLGVMSDKLFLSAIIVRPTFLRSFKKLRNQEAASEQALSYRDSCVFLNCCSLSPNSHTFPSPQGAQQIGVFWATANFSFF